MDKYLVKLVTLKVNPLVLIEWVVAICTALSGIYLVSPVYNATETESVSILAATLSHPIMLQVWGAVLLVGAALVILGLVKKVPQLRSIGWFSISLARFFQTLTTWLVAGFFPMVWLPSFTVMCVVLILWATARRDAGSG